VNAHYTEDDLTLYYYGEARRRDRIERHLGDCAACAALYREISGTLSMVVAPEVPERGDQYGLEVWQRIRHQLPEQDHLYGFNWFKGFKGFKGFGVVGAVAVLMLAAFVAGRSWQNRDNGNAGNLANRSSANLANPSNSENPANRASLANQSDVRDRILLTSVADHLDRSDRVLTDIMNAPDHNDISTEQRWAEDLLTTSRLYRQDAIDAGEQSVAGVLDELERSLLEIVHSPSKISAADLEQIRRRIDAASLLFKVRVMSDQLRRREDASVQSALPKSSTRTIS
jgi:hypothetical protein